MFAEWVGQAIEFLEKPKTTPARVVVVGDLALDRFVWGSVDRISPEAPVPVLVIEKTRDELGCAGNVIRNLSTLKGPFPNLQIDVFGIIGEDSSGDRLSGLVKNLGSHVHSFIEKDSSRPTIEKTRFLASSHHQLLRVDSEKIKPLSRDLQQKLGSAIEAKLKGASMLVIQDYAKGFLDEVFVQKLNSAARAQGIRTLVDPNRNTPPKAYKGSWMLTPNIAEAEVILGYSLDKGADSKKVAEAAQKIRKDFEIDVAMITRSHHGLTWVNEKQVAHSLPALARTVFDVTGAGDTLVAVLAAFLSAGASLEVAAAAANAAASVVVGKAGTATTNGEEILEELRRQTLV